MTKSMSERLGFISYFFVFLLFFTGRVEALAIRPQSFPIFSFVIGVFEFLFPPFDAAG